MVKRVDQRMMLAFGCLLNAVSLFMMTSLTPGMDYWSLAFPRFVQGFAAGFIYVPMSTLTLATIERNKLVNATAVYSMMRNVGASIGIAVVTTLLAQRSQMHQSQLVSHITTGDEETRARLAQWTSHFVSQGADGFTAERRAMAMLYRETVAQAQLLAYADDFWLLAVMFAAVPLVLPLMRRIRLDRKPPAAAPAGEPAPAQTAET
jgi:DHA2 family multidrug resistance protein